VRAAAFMEGGEAEALGQGKLEGMAIKWANNDFEIARSLLEVETIPWADDLLEYRVGGTMLTLDISLAIVRTFLRSAERVDDPALTTLQACVDECDRYLEAKGVLGWVSIDEARTIVGIRFHLTKIANALSNLVGDTIRISSPAPVRARIPMARPEHTPGLRRMVFEPIEVSGSQLEQPAIRHEFRPRPLWTIPTRWRWTRWTTRGRRQQVRAGGVAGEGRVRGA
jgi:hypothetical protein